MIPQANDNPVHRFLSSFETFEKSLNGQSALHIHDIRKAALAKFAELGFPTTHDEEWRFTNVSPIAKTQFSPVLSGALQEVRQEEIDRYLLGGVESARLVFIDGHFSARLSRISALPPGVKVGSLAAALKVESTITDQYLTRTAPFAHNAFTALNTAFLLDGAFIYVPGGAILRDALQVLFISTGRDVSFVSHPRNLIVVGQNSQLSIVESYVSLQKNVYFTNTVTEMIVGQGGIVEHDKLQSESERAFHVGTTFIRQSGSTTVTSNSISIGGALVRNDVIALLDAEGCECTLNGLSLATGSQHVDNHTVIDHAKPLCVSHELYKSILDGKAKGVFNGKILVRKDAQKTDAKQTNKTLLLSDDATIDTKPQLEIFADDVKCTHGATVGQLDEEQVFYLRSRGIPVEEARDILTFAFAADVINRVHVGPLREQLDQLLRRCLQQGRLFREE